MNATAWFFVILFLLMIIGFSIKTVVDSGKKEADTKDKVLISFRDLRMTRTELIEGYGPGSPRHPLAGLEAHVEDSGNLNRRITATRLATIGVFALAAKKKQDDRELFLSIAGPTTAIVINVPLKTNPKAGVEARAFAMRINQYSKFNSGEFKAQVDASLTQRIDAAVTRATQAAQEQAGDAWADMDEPQREAAIMTAHHKLVEGQG